MESHWSRTHARRTGLRRRDCLVRPDDNLIDGYISTIRPINLTIIILYKYRLKPERHRHGGVWRAREILRRTRGCPGARYRSEYRRKLSRFSAVVPTSRNTCIFYRSDSTALYLPTVNRRPLDSKSSLFTNVKRVASTSLLKYNVTLHTLRFI